MLPTLDVTAFSCLETGRHISGSVLKVIIGVPPISRYGNAGHKSQSAEASGEKGSLGFHSKQKTKFLQFVSSFNISLHCPRTLSDSLDSPERNLGYPVSMPFP